jgi:para-nitrobenzyl esterase
MYVFDHLYLKNWPWQDADRKAADDMSSYWINFAATGDPNGKGLPEWPAFSESDQQRMNFGNTVAAEKVTNKAALDFLEAHPATMGRGGR